MKYKTGWVLGMTASLIFISTALTFGQEPAVTVPETPAEAEVQWLWGEVISVDGQKNEILVKYLDYETDQEKEAAIAVDEKTAYENVKGISEIKPKDTVSIDYTVSPEGNNIAKNISVEKAESTETTPEDLQLVPEVEE